MKILEIGSCCASIPQLFADTLNTTHISFFSHKYLQNSKNEVSFGTKYSGYPGIGFMNRVVKLPKYLDLIKNFEFLHFHYNTYFPFYLDLNLYRKKIVSIHYHGDDIRQTPWKKKLAKKFDYIFLSTPDFGTFFPDRGVWLPSPVAELPYIGINGKSHKLVIGHMSGDLSNKKTRKGTDIIIKNIRKMNQSTDDFDLKIITGVSHQQAIEELKKVDLFIDQVTTYGSYGISAIEAMYLGKPVISSIIPNYYDDCPIIPVNANGENLNRILVDLKNDYSKLSYLSKKGRDYAIKFHSPKNAVNYFLNIIMD